MAGLVGGLAVLTTGWRTSTGAWRRMPRPSSTPRGSRRARRRGGPAAVPGGQGSAATPPPPAAAPLPPARRPGPSVAAEVGEVAAEDRLQRELPTAREPRPDRGAHGQPGARLHAPARAGHQGVARRGGRVSSEVPGNVRRGSPSPSTPRRRGRATGRCSRSAPSWSAATSRPASSRAVGGSISPGSTRSFRVDAVRLGDAFGQDAGGAAGVTGKVDMHWGDLWLTGLILVTTGAVEYEHELDRRGRRRHRRRDRRLGRARGRALTARRPPAALNLEPTITIRPGALITVRPRKMVRVCTGPPGLSQSAGVLYGRDMPERSDNRQHTAILTAKEVELLEREAERRGTSISSVLEWRRHRDARRVDLVDEEGLCVPSSRGRASDRTRLPVRAVDDRPDGRGKARTTSACGARCAPPCSHGSSGGL